MNNIQSLSKKTLPIINIILFLIPFSIIIFWVFNIPTAQFLINHGNAFLQNTSMSIFIKTPWNISQCLLGFFSSIIGYMPLFIGLLFMRKIFIQYTQNIIFTKQNARLYQLIGGCFIIDAIATSFISEIIFSWASTMTNPAGQRYISASLSNHTFESIICGIIVIIIGYVMHEGEKMKNEQNLTV